MYQTIEEVILSRHSVRAFTDQSVDPSLLEKILTVASYAPSGTNTQPWHIYVVTGQKRDEIIQKVSQVYDASRYSVEIKQQYQEVFSYYPTQWITPYIDRRRQNGWSLYELLNIKKGDKDRMHEQHKRNYCFFDAPIGLFFTTHQVMGDGAKMDIGTMMQNIMLMAKSLGLDTCAQAAWNEYHRIVLPALGAAKEEILVAAMALGYADTQAIINTFTTPREPLSSFTTWLDSSINEGYENQ